MLSVNNLSQEIFGKQLLKNISFKAQESCVTVLLGPNGAGKTTLLKSIIGLLPLKDRSRKKVILFNDQDITFWPVNRRVSAGLLYLPQQTSLFQSLTVYDNLQIVYEYQDYWRYKTRKNFVEERDSLLNQMFIIDTLKQISGVLSGGQKRKLEIVRSLLMHPLMILLDEPFAGVDPKSIYELKVIFREIIERGISIVLSDHHVDHLLTMGNQVYLLIEGNVAFSGTPRQVLDSSFARDNYLGNQFCKDFSGRL